jgi:hypothetical protein
MLLMNDFVLGGPCKSLHLGHRITQLERIEPSTLPVAEKVFDANPHDELPFGLVFKDTNQSLALAMHPDLSDPERVSGWICRDGSH